MPTATTTANLVRTASNHVRTVSPEVLEMHQVARTARIVDVREPEELAEQGWIAGSIHVPRGLLEFAADPASPLHLPELDPAEPTIVYCSSGARGALAGALLQKLGFEDVRRLDGGIAAWTRAGMPVAGTKDWHVRKISPATAGIRV